MLLNKKSAVCIPAVPISSVHAVQKGVNPAAGSPTATLLRLRSSYRVNFGNLSLRISLYIASLETCLNGVNPFVSNALNLPYFRSVTGGEYKAQVLIHRGVLIHDY